MDERLSVRHLAPIPRKQVTDYTGLDSLTTAYTADDIGGGLLICTTGHLGNSSMRQPDELSNDNPLEWSSGTGNQVWQMFTLSRTGDLDKLKRLVAAHPALVECQFAYRTPLYFAVRENHVEIVRYLLAAGANPVGLMINDSLIEISQDRGYREMEQLLTRWIHGTEVPSHAGEMLAHAIREHDLEKLTQLLDYHPEWIGARDDGSNEPIHWATMTRQPQIIDFVLQRGASIEAQRLDGARPLQLFHGDYHFRGRSRVSRDWPHTPEDILQHLLSRGAYYDMCTACMMGNVDRVRELLSQDPTAANRLSDFRTYYPGSGSPLYNAAQGGYLEIVKLLLASGADPNLAEPGIAPRGRALYSAIVEGHHELAEILLKAGSVANQSVESSADALSRAISNNDQRAINLLCTHGASRSVELLAYYGDLLTGAAVFAANPQLADDPIAFANAAGEGQDAFVHLMLRYCPDLPNKVEFPSWLVAAKNPEINRLLFRLGMDPNRSDWLGVTPMHTIAGKGRIDLAELFIEHGGRLDLCDETILSTPLGWAANFGQLEMVRYLLERGAPRRQTEVPDWAQPIEWAKRKNHLQIVDLLSR